jgi:thioredoxin
MFKTKEQRRFGRLIIVFTIITAVIIIGTGCKKKPVEQPHTERQNDEMTQSESVPGSPVKPARPDSVITAGQKVGSNGIDLIESLTKDSFLRKVYNYEQNKEWKFEGKLPCIIDFYADWCGPCKIVEPILQELAQEYQGKINIYRVDTEAQQELAAAFGIQSIPSILFVPLNDKPQMAIGALPKETLKETIKEVLKVE